LSIERPEENGSVNILAVEIAIDGKSSGSLVGGQARVINVGPGDHSILVYSADPYDPSSKNDAWRSMEIKVRLVNDSIVHIAIIPKTRGSSYVGGWELTVK
jgi:hypothetical protein